MFIKQNLPQKEIFPFSKLEEGFIRGSLGVLCGKQGSGKSQIAFQFLAENPSLQVAWVEDDFSIYPCAFGQYGVLLKRVLFIEAGLKNSLWCVHQLLRSTLFQVVIYSVSSEKDEVSLRRLQIAAEKAGALVLFLAEFPFSASWPLSAQIQVSRIDSSSPSHTTPTSEVVLNVLKYRGQRACQTEVV